jgi:hypothetical protein
MTRRAPSAGFGILVLLTIAACSTRAATPSPVPTSSPSRPQVVSMTGIDPCAVLTDEQVAQLGLKFVKRFANPPSQVNGNVPTCTWVAGGYEAPTTVYVQGVTYRGFGDVRGDRSFPQNDLTVRGFRAVARDNSDGSHTSCQVFVDAADGQTFEAAYTIESQDSSLACKRAAQAAEFGMTYLLDR